MKSAKAYIFLFLGSAWITLNVYFLPFFAWTTGVVLSWMILHGLVPYRDLVWNRTPLDLFFLAGWFNFFGSSKESYQAFIYFLFLCITVLVFIMSFRISPKVRIPSLLFFIIFLFPLFQNTEVGEMLIGLFPLLLLAAMYSYMDKRDLRILFLAGAVSSISVITKQTSGGIVLASLGVLFFDSYIKKSASLLLKSLTYYILGILIPALVFVTYLIYNKALPDFIHGVFGLTNTYLADAVPPGFSLGEGLWIEAAYLGLLVPFVLYWKQTGLSIQKVAFLALLIVCLSPTILPALLSYRAFPAFPLAALVAGVDIYILMSKKSKPAQKFIILLSLTTFIILTSRFINPYISSVKGDGFHYKDYIVDYGEPDYRVAEWIKKNTREDEKIMTSTSWVVYFLSNRMPKNRYMSFEPLLLLPYNESSRVFIEDPPRVFVLEHEILETRPELKKWPFFSYLKNNYKSVAVYGTSEIFVHK